MKNIIFQNWGLMPYEDAFLKQQSIFDIAVDQKKLGQTVDKQYLIFCEHPAVYTLGKSGNKNHLLVSDKELMKQSIDFFHSNRGGDITFHGKGQIVGYPIVDIEYLVGDIKGYMRKLEEVLLKTLKRYHLNGYRIEEATGVWIKSKNGGIPKKIAALGVKTSRWISMHGFALNVNTDLSYFDLIVPCGISDKGVTSMQMELEINIDKEEVEQHLKYDFEEVFDCKLIS